MMDAQLASFATVRELEYLEALEKHGSVIRAAKALKVARGSIQGAMRNLKKRAALRGYSPSHDMTKTVPDGFKVRGVSTYYDEEGKVRGQWVKSGIDEERREQIVREMLQTMAKDVKGLAPAIPAPKRSNADLMAVIPVGDPHNGLYVWAKECGDNFDTAIASKLATAAADRLIASAPACSVAVFLLLGDVLHANDQSNQTPGHKHQLDVDSRFVQVIGVAIETYRHILLRMLEKFPRVVVKLVPGNHDPQAIWALAYALHAYFVNEPRVEVDLGPSKFWYFQFGKVLLGATHGDTVKPERLPGIMAADRPEQWGASRFRYWYTGHIHSRNVTEFPGVMWESFRTLAAQDAYAASHGYRSGRDMVLIVHHREHGEVERHRCDVGMIA
jgi:hypothetical protein